MADVMCSVCGREVFKHFRQIAEVQLRRLGPIEGVEKLWLSQTDELKWIAGRSESCDLQINSAYASKKHFLITYKYNKYFISDVGSSNGTYVNDVRITSEQMLEYGNIVSVGVTSDYESLGDCVIYVFEKCYEGDEQFQDMKKVDYQRKKNPIYENIHGSLSKGANNPNDDPADKFSEENTENPINIFKSGKFKSYCVYSQKSEIAENPVKFFKNGIEENQKSECFRKEAESNFDRLYLQESYV